MVDFIFKDNCEDIDITLYDNIVIKNKELFPTFVPWLFQQFKSHFGGEIVSPTSYRSRGGIFKHTQLKSKDVELVCKYCKSSAKFYTYGNARIDIKIKSEPFPLKVIVNALTESVNQKREKDRNDKIELNENIIKQTYIKGILSDIGFEESEMKNGYKSSVKFKEEINFDVTDLQYDIFKITMGYNKTFESIPKEDFESMARNIRKYYSPVR